MSDDQKLIENWTAEPLMLLAGLEIVTRFRMGTGQQLLDEIERFYGSIAVAHFFSSFSQES